MGAAASKNDQQPQQQQRDEKSVQLGRALLNKLEEKTDAASEDNSASHASLLSSSRQSHLDSTIQSKIKSELSRLRSEEAAIRQKIEAALEKENLDRENKGSSKGAAGQSSVLLREELESLKKKIEVYGDKRKKVDERHDVSQARDKLVECYRSKPKQTLECWAEAQDFKAAVAKAEKDFVASLAKA